MYRARYSEKVIWGGECVRITASVAGRYRARTVLAQHLDRLRPIVRRNLAELLLGRIDDEEENSPKREPMLPDHRSMLLRDRNWPPDQTRSRKARRVAKLRKERR